MTVAPTLRKYLDQTITYDLVRDPTMSSAQPKPVTCRATTGQSRRASTRRRLRLMAIPSSLSSPFCLP